MCQSSCSVLKPPADARGITEGHLIRSIVLSSAHTPKPALAEQQVSCLVSVFRIGHHACVMNFDATPAFLDQPTMNGVSSCVRLHEQLFCFYATGPV